MANRSLDLWNHGVATIVEYPEHVSLVRHAGWGTLVRQAAPRGRSYNWLHVPIPTVTRWSRDDSILLDRVWFDIELNENAKLDLVHVREGDFRALEQTRQDINIDGREMVSFSLEREVNAPITLCLHIEFLDGTPEGQVIVRGAGGNFDRR